MSRGIDVSSYQPKPRWQQVAGAGAEFAIVKLTDGNHGINSYAGEQVSGAIAAGLEVMLYHYAEPNGPDWSVDATEEAVRLDDLADALEQKQGRTFFTFVDIERNTPLTIVEKPLWRGWLEAFNDSCFLCGRKTGDYSFKPFLEDLELPDEYSNHVLWLARYLKPWRIAGDYDSWPTAIKPWKRADLWQDGGDANGATWAGIDGPCDTNIFAGTLEELRDLCAAST